MKGYFVTSKSGKWAKLIMSVLILSTISLSGCVKRGVVAEAIPDFPVPQHGFVDVDGLACLDKDNANEYLIWMLALERYKIAVEGLK